MNKKTLGLTGLSIVALLAILYLAYDFQVTAYSMADGMFVVGVFYLFPGLVVATGASGLFLGVDYASKQLFRRRGEQGFKSIADYKAYKEQKNVGKDGRQERFRLLVIGLVYIIGSLMVTFIW